jgi:MoxR-like ATPase
MDRFMMRVSIGYPERTAERDILRAGSQKVSIENLPASFTAGEVVSTQKVIENGITVSEKILDYILSLAETTRNHPLIETGMSTRGAMVLLKCAKCVAWMRGRDYVVPEDVKYFAVDILAHRIQPAGGAKSEMGAIITSILGETPVP